MSASLQWPLRQWLNSQIFAILQTVVAPGFNQGFADAVSNVDPQRLTLPGFTVPTLGKDNVIGGVDPDPGGPSLGYRVGGLATEEGPMPGTYTLSFLTVIEWKAPVVGLSNGPEDITLYDSVMQDCLMDALIQRSNFTLTPGGAATPALPGGASFYECYLAECQPYPVPKRGSDKVTTYYGGTATHVAKILFGDDRPGALGQ